MDWKQTIDTVTFYHSRLRNCRGVGYELTRLASSKLNLRLILENGKALHAIHLRAEVEWPPTCIRNIVSTQVNNRIEEEILFNMLAVRWSLYVSLILIFNFYKMKVERTSPFIVSILSILYFDFILVSFQFVLCCYNIYKI